MGLTGEQVARFHRWLVVTGIAVISLLSWYSLYLMSQSGMGGGVMAPGGIDLLVAGAFMWMVMMLAMMVPTATPMVLGFNRAQLRRRTAAKATGLTWLFITGYLLAWCAFSMAAAGLQWLLYNQQLMSSAMGNATPLLAASVLVAAGVFQWSDLKDACLSRCQSPLGFLLNGWREGGVGALVMGLRHGVFCVGCCWLLMLLMFVGGVMNLLWMAAITLYVFAEKLVPKMRFFGRLTGGVLVAAGLLMALQYAL